jgi:guanylate kinase
MSVSNTKRADLKRRSAGPSNGRLFIVSAPSGAGKTTLCNALRNRFKDLAYSISYTTRAPRPEERHGRDYHFIDKDEFERGIAGNRWAEWATVHGHYYGSSAKWVDETLKSGADILMDIDVQGARQIVARFPLAVTIFILPPSLDELERRLQLRATDDAATVALRLANAREEVRSKDQYHHVVINDDLDRAVSQLMGIVQGHRDS